MKAKLSAMLSLAILLMASASAVRAQSPNCYDYKCPTNIVVPCEGAWGAHVWYSVQVTNYCNPSAPPNVTYSTAPGSIFPPGTNKVWATIEIPGLQPQRCYWDVIVDCCSTNCIEIICPTNMVVRCQDNTARPGAFVDIPRPRATNHCGDLPANLQWRSMPAQTPGQPNFFPPGTNTVVWCATDAAGNVHCCSFDIVVINCPQTTDQCRPEIICPKDVQIQCEGPNGGFAFFEDPKVIDPCGLVVSISMTHSSGSFFPNGKTTVAACITYKDPVTGDYLTDCCSFDVIVRCCPPPTNCVSRIDCPGDRVIDCPGPNGTVLNYSVFGTNTCEETRVICNPPPGTIIFGPTNVFCKLTTTSGQVLTQCWFKVIVKDTVPPAIYCPADITATSSNCGPVAIALPVITAADDCDPNPRVRCVPDTNVFPCGLTTVICVATDYSGNENKCSFNVTVLCDSRTEIRCPEDILITCAAPTGAVVNYTIYATNKCTNIVSISCSPPSGSVFLPGTHPVGCQVVDGFGETNRCGFKVTVRPDDVPPTIVCPNDVVVNSPNCAPVDVLYPLPTATDNCAVDYVRCTPPPGSPFSVGTQTVTCWAWDKAGNSNRCSFKVTVRCPSNDCVRIICSTNILMECAGPNGAVVTYNSYAINTCTGGILPVTCSKPSGSVFPIGLTTVYCTNVTAGVMQTCFFDVVVRRDVEPPVINCPTNIHILCARPNGTSVPYNVTATDKCDPTPTITCIPPSGSVFLPGCTNVTCVATDDAGNSSTCTFKVCVVREGCYLTNPSFELLAPNLAAAAPCGDPIGFATGWKALSGTPDLWRPPYASFAPGNCRGRERPCQGTNYAGLEGGYTSSGGFATEAMMGTLVAPLTPGERFRLRSCLSLAESSPGPVLVEFVLANSADPTQQAVIHQVWVTQRDGWMQFQPPCFTVPRVGNWDRLIIRAARAPAGTPPYQPGYVYVDNVNICCCKPELQPPVIRDGGTVVVAWTGRGQLQGAKALSDNIDWQDVNTPVEYDPETDVSTTKFPMSAENLFFRVVGAEGEPVECSECGM